MDDCICRGFYINPNCLVCGYKSKTDSIEKLRNENNELFRKLKNKEGKIQELESKVSELEKATEGYRYRGVEERLNTKIQELEAFKKEALELLRLALSFAPRGEVPKGLDPSFYHTLNYDKECFLQSRINEAHEFLSKHGDKNDKRSNNS